jgi:hypothetical protein
MKSGSGVKSRCAEGSSNLNSNYSSSMSQILPVREGSPQAPLALATGPSAPTVARAIKRITGGRNKRRALTVLEKHQICKKRKESKFADMKLEDFGELFPGMLHFNQCQRNIETELQGPDGKPLARSTLGGVLQESKKWEAIDISATDNWRKKVRRENFPVLEKHLIEWVYRAQLARVSTTDEVIVTIARKLAGSLTATIPLLAEPEDYSGFEFSAEWLTGVKQRYGLGRMKQQGNSEIGDPEKFGIPAMKESIRAMVSGYKLDDIYNADELALQYVLTIITLNIKH